MINTGAISGSGIWWCRPNTYHYFVSGCGQGCGYCYAWIQEQQPEEELLLRTAFLYSGKIETKTSKHIFSNTHGFT